MEWSGAAQQQGCERPGAGRNGLEVHEMGSPALSKLSTDGHTKGARAETHGGSSRCAQAAQHARTPRGVSRIRTYDTIATQLATIATQLA